MKNLHVFGKNFLEKQLQFRLGIGKKNEACEEVVLFETNPSIVCFHKDVATNLMELKRNPPLEK